MRVLFLLLVLAVIAYVLWQFIPADVRKEGVRQNGKHLFRIGLIFIVIAGLAYAAYYLPVSSLTF